MGIRRVEPRHRLKIGKKGVFDFEKFLHCMRLRSGRTVMSGTNTNDGGSDPVESTVTSGSTSSSGPNASTASAQSSAVISTFIGNTRLDTEFEQKRFHDENRSNPTAGGSFNSDTNPTPGGSFNFGVNCSNLTARGSWNSDANPTVGGSFNSGANCSNPSAGGSCNSSTNSGGNGNR
ncbi:hypothetical protein PIB30_030526 [Stylosanthes scabra]|uniref:Uncharacterized protein n=1 Tax=Stylosanthes scabra TaxID=79078 RepID=A0ABU6ZBB4_9FABA|nr:hypothetical protein [Stylosanthes scabra]